MDPTTKAPRLYTPANLVSGGHAVLDEGQAHYLKNVLRRGPGDILRLFNGQDGEFLGRIAAIGKKNAEIELETLLRPQLPLKRRVHLFFAPIKKNRMDFLIEKAVELGVTDLHPIVTRYTEVRALKEDRLQAQIIEAAEQCERLDLPVLQPVIDMFAAVKHYNGDILACIERGDHPAPQAQRMAGDVAGLIGPEGGFTLEEIERLSAQENIKFVSLGDNILRAETAALKILCLI